MCPHANASLHSNVREGLGCPRLFYGCSCLNCVFHLSGVCVVGTRRMCHVHLTQGVLTRTPTDPPDPSAPPCAPIQSRGPSSSR